MFFQVLVSANVEIFAPNTKNSPRHGSVLTYIAIAIRPLPHKFPRVAKALYFCRRRISRRQTGGAKT
jgi:hypothetical protein